MIFAYWVLAELPTMPQVIGSMILPLGLLLSQIKRDRAAIPKPSELRPGEQDGGGVSGL